jgi:hypothetical protein
MKKLTELRKLHSIIGRKRQFAPSTQKAAQARQKIEWIGLKIKNLA